MVWWKNVPRLIFKQVLVKDLEIMVQKFRKHLLCISVYWRVFFKLDYLTKTFGKEAGKL